MFGFLRRKSVSLPPFLANNTVATIKQQHAQAAWMAETKEDTFASLVDHYMGRGMGREFAGECARADMEDEG